MSLGAVGGSWGRVGDHGCQNRAKERKMNDFSLRFGSQNGANMEPNTCLKSECVFDHIFHCWSSFLIDVGVFFDAREDTTTEFVKV